MKTARVVILCALVSGLISWLVVQWQLPDESTDFRESPGRIALADRETVTLAEHQTQNTISGNGSVVPGTDADEWVIEVPVTPSDLAYKLLDTPIAVRAILNGGPAGFACAWLGLDRGQDGAIAMRCRIPADVRAANGMLATVVVELAAAETIVGLPRTAVLGDATIGQVVIVHDDDTIEVREVELGISDTEFIEVKSGLSDDERVLLVPMQRDFASVSEP